MTLSAFTKIGNRAKVDQKELLDVKQLFTCNDVNELQEDGEMEHDLKVFTYGKEVQGYD